MGVEFLLKVGKQIKVARDKDLVALATGDLFTRTMALPSVFELLRLSPGKSVMPGDEVQIERVGDKVVAIIGDVVVGVIDTPMPAVGVIGGRIDEVHDGARVADVEITE